ncbi:hypothetical protein T439DRAFT_382876 [Meredithblackwellia eburnea MCA 4105]
MLVKLAALAVLVGVLGVRADATIKKSVHIQTTLSALCRSWKGECANEALETGTGVGGFLFRCKALSSTVATVTCVSKDFHNPSTPEAQLTVPVIKKLGLIIVPNPKVTTPTISPSVSLPPTSKNPDSSNKSISSTNSPASPAATMKKDPTIKRTVQIPSGLTLSGLCKKWKTTCHDKGLSIADSGSLFRCKPIGTPSLKLATVTCVSKDFTNPKVPEQQLTDTIIKALGLKRTK